MKSKTIPLEGVTALLGAEEKDPAGRLAASLPEGQCLAVMEEKSRIDPFLTMKQNANYYKMNMTPEKAARLDELVKLSGLRTREKWDHPFRKDMTGERQLWRVLLTLLLEDGPVLLPQPLAGMASKEREGFAAILRSEAERGRAVVFTAASLKDVMSLGAADRVCFAAGEDFAVYTPEEIAARREALGGEDCSYDDLAGRLAEVDHV